MEQNFNNAQQQNGSSQSMVFGDNNFFSFDPSSLDHQPSGQTILNDTEDNFLSTFFDNPNMAQQAGQFDSMFAMDDKSQSVAHYPGFGYAAGSLDHAATPLQPQLQKPRAASHIGGPDSGQHHVSDLTGQSAEVDNGLFDAASSLFNLKTPQASYAHSSSTDNQISGSWGNLFNPNVAMAYGTNGYPPAGSQSSVSGGQHQSSFTSHQNAQQMWNADISHGTNHQQNIRAPSDSSSHFNYQQPQPTWRGAQSETSSHTPQSLRRPPIIGFGSDPNFSSTHFRGPGTDPHYDKGINLLNVPLADKARSPANPFSTPNGTQSTSAYGGGAQMQDPFQGGASWGNLRPADSVPRNEFESGHSQALNKRRTSRANQEDDQEWRPAGNIKVEAEGSDDDDHDGPSSSKQSNKRRRLTEPRAPQASNSPLGDDDDEEAAARRKRGSKKRDNLTEEEKRRNHIQSEKKRREIIQQGYSELNKLVPCLASGKSGLSRSECLQEIASYLEVLIFGTNTMMAQLGVTEEHPELAAIKRQMQADADAIER